MSRESEEFIEVEARLRRERPVPAPAFRGDLKRSLMRDPAGVTVPSKARLAIKAYAMAGATLLAAATLGVAGIGPLS